ncbi:hypothetical protein [Lactococcus fujiensis]
MPYIPSVILNVDVKGKRVDVDIMDGLDDDAGMMKMRTKEK